VNWIRTNKRSALIVGLTFLVPAILFLDGLFGLIAVRQAYQGDVENLERRISRLQGLVAVEDALRESTARVDTQVQGLFYPVSADQAEVSATLQTDVRRTLVESGLSVKNSQVLPVRERERFDYIGVKLMATGDLAGLDAALAALSTNKPALAVESLEIWPNRGSAVKGAPAQQTITASLQLLSLRAVQ
jgi:general secretion pathway protein M